MHPLSQSQELEAAFLQNRGKLLRFVVARGGGDAAEDILQELWLRLAKVSDPEAAAHPAYMMRAANTLMIDRFRSAQQSKLREHNWAETQPGIVEGISMAPDAMRIMEGREHARIVEETLAMAGERASAIFRRHRLDGVPQREIASEFSVSLSTVESDLRRVYRMLAEVKELIDEA